MKRHSIILMGLCLSMMSLVHAASFDCSKAQTKVETLICKFPQLSAADEQLGEAYAQAIKALPTTPAAQLREEQRAWLEERDQFLTTTCIDQTCLAKAQTANACFNIDCAVQFYTQRINLLAGDTSEPVDQLLTASFDCAKARTDTEKLICANPRLSDADGRLGQTYTQLKGNLAKTDEQDLQKAQGTWLQTRDKQIQQCAGNIECALAVYSDRILELQDMFPEVSDGLDASFDCAKAATPAERLICSDSQLRDLDGQLGEIYKQLQTTLSKSEAAALQKKQKTWLKNRDQQLANCGSDINCAIEVYEDRITMLNLLKIGGLDDVDDAVRVVAGDYVIGNYMSLHVKSLELDHPLLEQDHLLIEIEGAEPTAGKWLCHFSGVGTLTTDNTVKICHADQDTPILFTFSADTVKVSGENLDYFCGMGGTIAGEYKKLDR